MSYGRLRSIAPSGMVALFACLSDHATSPEYPNPVTGKFVLFIGNSLTYTNDLPVIVQGIADAAGGDSLVIAMRAGPDMALIDHWNGGGAKGQIQSRHWDFVVLQQGPSSVALNRDTLRLATALFQPSIAAAGAKAVLFSAWPTVDRRQDFPAAAESYRLAAADVGGLYAPVANAWIAAWNRDPTLEFYQPDGLHPTLLGSYLAAMVIYSRITATSPVGLPAAIKLRTGGSITFSSAVTATLQAAAWEATSAALTTPAARRPRSGAAPITLASHHHVAAAR